MLREKDILSNKYQLIRKLGGGAFSSVWLAYDSVSQFKVALKIYAPNGGLDDNGIEEFRKEFGLVFDLNHGNIVRPFQFEVDRHKNLPFLVLPYYQKGSALSVAGKVSEDELWQFMLDVASGLDYLHNHPKRIIHQDIKPANVLVDDSNHYLITDFGISVKLHATIRKTIRSLTKESNGVGSIPYMGPERFSENPAPVLASDIWSLGASAYELITGEPPFRTEGGMLQLRGAKIPKISAKISSDLRNLIYACLSKNTWERPSAGAIVECCRHKKFISRRRIDLNIVKVLGVVLLVTALVFCVNYVLHKERVQKFESLCKQGDIIVMVEKEKAKSLDELIENRDIDINLAKAVDKYSEALTVSSNNEEDVAFIEKRISGMNEILDSCSAYKNIVDTISLLIEEQRMSTASEYKQRRLQLSKNIKLKIIEL